LIGKEALFPLCEANYEVYALSTLASPPVVPGIQWISGNIFDSRRMAAIFADVRPECLLHFAWTATGDYLTTGLNYRFRDASLSMLEYFFQNGGQKAVFAGTAFEYEFADFPLKETDPLNPQTPYARCKDELRQRAEEFAHAHNFPFGWGRIFYVIGHNEDERRLIPGIVAKLVKGNQAVVRHGGLVRDYMYARDIAGAMVKFLDSAAAGCVNICTGDGIALGSLAKLFATAMGREEFLVVKDEPSGQPNIIVGNPARLTDEVGYRRCHSLKQAIESIVGGTRS
jgi:nucleoside-diphosphate-sugar epimerase